MKELILQELRKIKVADEESRIILEQIYGALATSGTVIEYRREPTENNIPTEDYEFYNID